MKKKAKSHSKAKKGAIRRVALHRAFHELLSEWNLHVRREMALHKTFHKGSASLKKHLKDTIKIEKKFVKTVERLLSKSKKAF